MATLAIETHSGAIVSETRMACDSDTGVTTFSGAVFVRRIDLTPRNKRPALREEDYPVLARIWDNEGDAIFDTAG